MRTSILCVVIWLMLGISLSAQSSRLANQYYSTGEYEKAGDIYLQLYNKTKNSTYYTYYIKALMAMEKYDMVEKSLKAELRKNKSPDLYVSLGDMYERTSQPKLAEEQYRNAINTLEDNKSRISKLAGAFVQVAKYDLAIEAYRKGAELIGNENMYAFNLAGLYHRKNDVPNMIEQYILAIELNPNYLRSVKTNFSRRLAEEDLGLVAEVLYTRIQKNPENLAIQELLQWVHMQKRDYSKALRQAIALDLRLEENGKRIQEVGTIAKADKNYQAAIKAFEYIVSQKPNSPFFLKAQDALMESKKLQVIESYDYSMADIETLEQEYITFLNKHGKNRNTAQIMADLASLQALYLHDLDKAIEVLEELISITGVQKNLRNQSKLDLGDYYLMNGDPWEATLLYSQVDKELKEAYLGEMARYKNAKLSYFTGDFTWAQSQFDVLKASTSRLISNDAIDLSVFITDNLGLDTITTPMEMYANAELLSFQNKYDEAFELMDSILIAFPDHGLIDDIYFTKAQIFLKRKEWKEAERYFIKIMEEYPEEIRADNAIFALASLYENQLIDIEKAKELYKKIFIDYSDSTFMVESRKRYRRLRGDNIQ